jgi:hypothetical protein
MINLCGWFKDDRAVDNLLKKLPIPLFGEILKDTGQGKDIFLWKAEEQLNNKIRPPHKQQFGDCVSHSLGAAIDDLRYIRIAWNNLLSESFVETSTEAIYGGSRIEIGKGQCGDQDGSTGAWAIDWVLHYGVLPRLKYDQYDLTQYDPKLAKEWGQTGLPKELEDEAKHYPVKTASLITGGYNQARDAIGGAKCPIIVCSNQGFSLSKDSMGFCTPHGVWAHCMYFRGVSDNANRPGLVCQQSWGPNLPSGSNDIILPSGLQLTLPQGAFFVDAEVVDHMLAAGDSYVISDMIGYRYKSDDIFNYQLY